MSDIAIRVQGLGKQYRIGKTQPSDTLREQIQAGFSAPFRKMASFFNGDSAGDENGKDEIFWALKDVSFEVPRGSVLGVIGRNGAGKSTLLKILSRITEPTEGRAEIHGRVGSLLEVGTGFSGELSGRDNIFLNGAILGMKKAEITRKFDEIVAFAEVEKFVDTAVKFYSSGMYMRLAFAVAAHLEPEILIVDEVLAVGDASFQKKCIGKMGDVAKHGRTVLFVSHNMRAITQLTQECVLLRKGRIELTGSTDTAIQHYLAESDEAATSVYHAGTHGRRWGDFSRDVEFVSFELREHENKMIDANADLVVWITVKGNARVDRFRFSVTISRSDGYAVGSAFGAESLSIEKGETATFEFRMSELKFAPGDYLCGFGVGRGDRDFAFDVILDVVHFRVLSQLTEDGTLPTWHSSSWGAIRLTAPEYEKLSAPIAV